MAHRGENIYKRKDGRWEGRYKNGFRPDGRAKYTSVYAKTYTEVKNILLESRLRAAKGCKPCGLTVKNF